ncbi:serine/threonine protein kinase [Leucobacter coleopterorum]|uniref:Serine/threonine protein kinase n=2 Tax=Leucobacter coleopterorum TaxID=2714933 RepID=A0ABX6JZD2_9MICO|nr:serine/threonine protein kinase [Leucobacter coleopterorum]
MAMVYLANDLRLERRVAVKVMHEHLAEDDNFTRRFEQEARSAARLSHPNLVNVFDQGQDLGRTYLVMEYLPSITLRDLLKQQKHLTIEQTLEVGEAVLAGLSAAHQSGIVHRDLKPENVMLADDGRIKLGDFGLARAVSANTTTGQALLGTIAYLSPELVTRGVADARSDLYAFGVMLYEMLTGAQPFTGEQPMQIAYQHAHSEVPVPSLKNVETPPELDELVRWTTQREPDQRPRDAGEALEYISALRHGAPVQATRVLPPLGLQRPSPRQRRCLMKPNKICWLQGTIPQQALTTVQASSPRLSRLLRTPHTVAVFAGASSRSVWLRLSWPRAGSAGGLGKVLARWRRFPISSGRI